MDKKILNKLIKNGVVNRIYQKNLNKAFINSLFMLMKDVKVLKSKGVNTNAQKNWSNPFASPTNGKGFSKNVSSYSNNWDKGTVGSSNSGFKPATLKQIKYIKYLIYLLSKDYSSSSYGQIDKEIRSKNGLKAIDTRCVTKAKAYHLIKSLKSMIPTKPKAKPTEVSSGLPF